MTPEKLSLVEMARLVASRDISPRQLVDAHLDRIEQVNPQINAFTTLLADEARASAARMENVEPAGPLFGVPVTVKDNFDVRGVPTLCGSKMRLGVDPPSSDAPAVARLRAAGAIILAKTNVPDLVASYETDNYITGRTNNPWDVGRTPGGSSGGEAAAIAAFCSAGGLGSDGGGSIRVPAHFCGVAGFKPTHGRISGAGMYPPLPPPAALMASAGPMARTVRDLQVLFEVIRETETARQPLPKRVSLIRQFYRVPVDPAIAAALEAAARKFESLGYTVEEWMPAGLEKAPNLWSFFFNDLGVTRRLVAGHESDAHWTATEFLRDVPEPEPSAIAEALATRDQLLRSIAGQMEQHPLLLMPVSSIPAFCHRERRYRIGEQSIGQFAAMACSTIWNLLGYPALSVPFGRTADGLPVGVQLVARAGADEALLDAGIQLELDNPSI